MSFLSQKIFSKCRRMAEVKIVVLIIVWWIASTLTFEFSKDEISITEQSFGDIKWLDLTCLQLIVGCLGSAILLFLLKRRLFGLKIIQSYNSLVAVATNVIGHLLVNVSYAFESSSVTQGHEFLHEVLEKFSLDYSATMNLREVNLMSKVWYEWQRKSKTRNAVTVKNKNYFRLLTAELLNSEQNLYEVIEETTAVIRIAYHDECVEKWNKGEVVLRKNSLCKSIYKEHCLTFSQLL
ncbi:uncharacterized protein LOC124458151 isoform X1 [Xenia sp. Carnegie-2017]|uniref:uncharacterized protein LOC124458151 isoform X1 n=1 Tax=Xenia sp. Carnegie-2017 TaxID=2897299 RepID=UPI001F03FA54|nr:uncharacterized protein LOC124458151 isoform X1 [Xenia sp. Carnegie-2017]